jgi:hypothetical protein
MRFFFFAVCLAAASCNNAEIAKAKDVSAEAIYYDYKIWGEEGRDEVTLVLQYRFGGENGTTLVLDEGAKVSLDGEVLKADSAKLTGAFYEIMKPVEEFKGKHLVVFTDKEGKEHREEFTYLPFTLAAELPETVKKGPLTIKLKDFAAVPTPVRLVMTDTAFSSKDVNEELLVRQGELKITSRHWNALESGPVTLEIYREEERQLKNASKEGGRLTITYSLKREFTMID